MVQQLTWREIGLLETGEHVTLLSATKLHVGKNSQSDVTAPAGTTAVVVRNTLREDGDVALVPDDPGLRAGLQDVGRQDFFLATPFGNSPPGDDEERWDQLGPLGQETS